MKYYNRRTKTIEESVEYKENILFFLYNTKFGRILLKLFVARPWVSKIYGLYQKSPLSKKDIKPFVKKYNIDVSDKEMEKFRSFNDFFIRKPKIIPKSAKRIVISIADAKLSIYNISEDLTLKIKNSTYTVESILQNKELASFFKNGTCLVYRLAVNDVHHYNFIDDGQLAFHKKIKGKLHTIRPIAEKYNIYSENSREVSLLKTDNIGYVAQVEVGALLVGKIKNNNKRTFKKTEEKGYFEFGGSTIVLFVNNENIVFDDDIVNASKQGIETQVFAGERIGLIQNA